MSPPAHRLWLTRVSFSKPVWVGKRELSYRDHALVKIHTDDGIVGMEDLNVLGQMWMTQGMWRN